MIEAQKNLANKTCEGFLTNGTVSGWRILENPSPHKRLPLANIAEIIQHYKTTKTTASMTTEEVTCRVLVIKPYGNNDDASLAEKLALVCLKDCPNTATETRLLWAQAIARKFWACSKRYDCIRPWEFILNLDGTAECLAVPPSKSHHDKVYQARFCIPPDTLLWLGQEGKEQAIRDVCIGSLLYEINSGNKPFEELSDDKVQLRFGNRDFPDSDRVRRGACVHGEAHPRRLAHLKTARAYCVSSEQGELNAENSLLWLVRGEYR